MLKQSTWPSIIITLLALAVVYGVGTTFFTLFSLPFLIFSEGVWLW